MQLPFEPGCLIPICDRENAAFCLIPNQVYCLPERDDSGSILSLKEIIVQVERCAGGACSGPDKSTDDTTQACVRSIGRLDCLIYSTKINVDYLCLGQLLVMSLQHVFYRLHREFFLTLSMPTRYRL